MDTSTNYVPNLTGVTKVGDIFVSRFGYEASFSDFYVVTKVTDKMVGLAMIDAVSNWRRGGMEGTTFPVFPVVISGETKMFKQKPHGIKINTYTSAHQWGGTVQQVYNHH